MANKHETLNDRSKIPETTSFKIERIKIKIEELKETKKRMKDHLNPLSKREEEIDLESNSPYAHKYDAEPMEINKMKKEKYKKILELDLEILRKERDIEFVRFEPQKSEGHPEIPIIPERARRIEEEIEKFEKQKEEIKFDLNNLLKIEKATGLQLDIPDDAKFEAIDEMKKEMYKAIYELDLKILNKKRDLKNLLKKQEELLPKEGDKSERPGRARRIEEEIEKFKKRKEETEFELENLLKKEKEIADSRDDTDETNETNDAKLRAIDEMKKERYRVIYELELEISDKEKELKELGGK